MAAGVETFGILAAPIRIRQEAERRLARAELVEASLLARVAAGDEEAFAALYDRVSPIIYGMALRILFDPRDAEEAMMDALLHVWRRAETFDSGLGSATAWVIMIGRCRVLDRARVQKVRRQYEESLKEEWEASSTEPDAESHVVLQRNREAVQAALAQIPAAQKRVVQLAFFEGMTHQEIAEVTCRPLGTVKTQIRQGLLKLRGLLAPKMDLSF